jgi:hypothetical protein
MLRDDHALVHVFAVTEQPYDPSERDPVAYRSGVSYARTQGTRMWPPVALRDVLGREPSMTVDPTDPETFVDEDIEDAEAFDVEAPEVDAAEQQTEVRPDRDEPLTGVDPDRANEADLVEQARVVSLDEDDYR